MFNIVTTPQFSRTVTVKVKVPDGDGYTEQTFKAHFKAGKDDEIIALNWFETDEVKEALRAILVSAEDLVGEGGKPVAYCDAVREGLLNLSYVRMALLKTYTTALVQETAGN